MSNLALITGVAAQDGADRSELLLAKSDVAPIVKRGSSSFDTSRIDHRFCELTNIERGSGHGHQMVTASLAEARSA